MTLRVVLILAVLAVLAACSGPSERQEQAASNAVAGTQALVDPRKPASKVIGQGVVTNIETAVGVKLAELPAPTLTPTQILDNPEGYKKEADDNSKAFWTATGFWAWAGGGLLAVLGVLRFVPGAHQPVVSVLQTLLESKVDRAAREREEHLAQAARGMMDAIDAVPPTGKIADVKAKIAKTLPAGAGDAVKEYLQTKRAPHG